MSDKNWMRTYLLLTVLVLCNAAQAQNSAANPYRTVDGWANLPDGRVWGSTSAVYPANDGENIWVAERCGTNLCVGSDLDPVMLFDPNGNVIRSFGAGMITWPHGIFVDADDNVWIADAVGYAPVPDGVGRDEIQPARRVADATRDRRSRRCRYRRLQQAVRRAGGARRQHLCR
jgi:hypothetical protein